VNPTGSVSTQEAAIILGLSTPTLLKLLRQKKIPEPQVISGARHWNAADLNHARVVIAALHASGELRTRGVRK
jgi:excisionase family DNA binding protein